MTIYTNLYLYMCNIIKGTKKKARGKIIADAHRIEEDWFDNKI